MPTTGPRPSRLASTEPDDRSPPSERTLEQSRVVLVAADGRDRSLLVDVLAGGHRVAVAPSAEVGYELCQTPRPDLLVCDLDLPGSSAEELIARLRREADAFRPGHLPILVVSGRNEPHLRVRLLCDGADDVLLKPFPPAELRSRADDLIWNGWLLAEAERRAEEIQRAFDDRVLEHAEGLFTASDVSLAELREVRRGVGRLTDAPRA